MADTIHVEDLQYGLPDIIKHVLANGDTAEPRGLKTTEVLCPTIIHHDPSNILATGIGRKMNVKLAALEALQMIGGISDPGLMVKVAPNTRQFLDGGIFFGAYGPRLHGQVDRIVPMLKADPDSRQCVLSIWEKNDLYVDTKDKPCTLSLQFFIRRGKLLLRTVMRSNDCYWGVTYDFVMFTQLQFAVAQCLGIPVGDYIHQPGSLHVYHRDLEAIESMHEPTEPATRLGAINWDGETWPATSLLARKLMYDTGMPLVGLTPTAQWFSAQAASWR